MAMPLGAGVITCNIPDLDTLYKSYLGFVSEGGIFVPSSKAHKMGEDVFVAFTLPGSKERYPLNGKIVWLNQKGTATRPAGFGIQFGKDMVAQRMKNEVERLLAGQTENDRPTYTL